MKRFSFSMLTLISAISLVLSMSGQILNPIVAVYARDTLNASIGEIGLIVSSFFFVSIISKPIIGLRCQGMKTLYFFLLALAIIAFPTLGMALTESPTVFVILRIFQGIGNSMFWAPGITLVALISSKGNLEKDLSNYSFIISIGMSLGPALGSTSVAIVGTRNSFLLSSAIMLSGFLLGIFLIKNRRQFQDKLKADDPREISLKELPRIVHNKPFQMAFISYVSMSFIYGINMAYGTLYFKDTFNVFDENVAILFFGYNLVVMLTRFGLRKLITNTSKRNILLFSLVNYMILLTIILVSSSFPIFVVAFCLLGLSHGLIYPTGILMIAGAVKSSNLAFANSIFMTGNDVGNSIGPLIAAPFAANYGIRAALFVALLSPIATLITISLLSRRTPNESVNNVGVQVKPQNLQLS